LEVNQVTQFSTVYAECYDLIHSKKSYENEISQLLKFIKIHFKTLDQIKLLDFGCGTGGHLEKLHGTNLSLTGYDINRNMLAIARKRLKNIEFYSELENIGNHYDLVYSLFDVINYQHTDDLLKNYLKSINSVLAPGGILVCDGWNLSGVKLDPPSMSKRTFKYRNTFVTREVEPLKSIEKNITKLKITLIEESKKEILVQEMHTMRSFDPIELTNAALELGFSNIEFKDGSNWGEDLRNDSWRFVMFATKSIREHE